MNRFRFLLAFVASLTLGVSSVVADMMSGTIVSADAKSITVQGREVTPVTFAIGTSTTTSLNRRPVSPESLEAGQRVTVVHSDGIATSIRASAVVAPRVLPSLPPGFTSASPAVIKPEEGKSPIAMSSPRGPYSLADQGGRIFTDTFQRDGKTFRVSYKNAYESSNGVDFTNIYKIRGDLKSTEGFVVGAYDSYYIVFTWHATFSGFTEYTGNGFRHIPYCGQPTNRIVSIARDDEELVLKAAKVPTRGNFSLSGIPKEELFEIRFSLSEKTFSGPEITRIETPQGLFYPYFWGGNLHGILQYAKDGEWPVIKLRGGGIGNLVSMEERQGKIILTLTKEQVVFDPATQTLETLP